MKDQIGQKLHLSHLSCLCRRTVALTLALAMVLPTAAFGAGPEIEPGIRVPHALEPGEEPTITVEANAVVNRWYDKAMGDPSDYLTGDLEVAIRVQSGQIGGVWQPFNTLSVALDYSPILTPYKWTLIDGIDLSGEDLSHLTPEERVDYKTKAPNVTEVDLVNNATYQFDEMTSMQTLKSKQITTAVAHVSGQMEKDAEGNVTAVKDGHLYMMAQADRPVVLEKDTVLAVVTFKYDVENIKILASQAPDWFKWLVDAGTSTAAEGDEGDGATGDGTGDGTTGDTTGGVAPEDKWLVKVTDITPTNESYFAREIHYDSQDNSMYYSVDRKGLYAGLDTTVTPPVEVYVDNYIKLNHKVNDVAAHQVNFTLVNQTTYNDGGLTLDDLATVLFYDWDDTLLGLVIVPKDGDARKIVNDYIGSHFIHPQLATNTNYTSLARVDNYRGKYPTTAMSEEDAKTDKTAVTNGGEYALTNKLDYVFFKRPMERAKITVGTGENAREVDGWKQKIKTGVAGEEGDWDTKYPYLYGWAIVPDYRYPEKVWTTLGMGELADYNYSSEGGFDSNILPTTPATLVPTNNFEFADFDFRVKNDNSLAAGSIYAVKAVYEPGEKLLSRNYRYRMISEPYYNKFNDAYSGGGGAYQVSVTYERASTQVENIVRGVARIRMPVVRQNTTTDLLWEEVETLSNPTITEAYTTRTKTTYTKIDVENTEEIAFSMALSARQNRVDYFLAESFNSNFVTGGARNGTNNEVRGASAFALDNYNYATGDGDTDSTDEYYDAPYVDRDGSRGFILYGTLNNIMEQATYFANDSGYEDFYSYVTTDNMKDANLHMANGLSPSTILDEMNMQNSIADAAKEAQGKKGNLDYWDNDHNCAQLTYHQLQLYIMGKGLLSREDADKIPIKWCHLHETCAALASGKPTSLKGMVDLARAGDPEGKIKLLELERAEDFADLRADKAGSRFASIDAYADTFVGAVMGIDALDPSFIDGIDFSSKTDVLRFWDAVQGWILSGTTLPTKIDTAIQISKDIAWWYDKNTYPTRDLAGVVDAAQKANSMGREAWLNYIESAYDDMMDKGVTPNCQWTAYTENLTKKNAEGEGGEAFDTFEDFKTAIKKAVQVPGLDLTAWGDIQYAILHNYTAPIHSAEGQPETADEKEIAKYWWHFGRARITGLISLYAAATDAVAGDSTVLDMLTAEDLYKYKELRFRSGFNGTKNIYVDNEDSSGNPVTLEDGQAYISDFKEAVKEFVRLKKGTIATSESQITTSWNHLQYYLIHPDSENVPGEYRTEAGTTVVQGYYWWRENDDGEAYRDFNPGYGDTNVATLMEAVYRYVENGNPMALDGLDKKAAEDFRLIPAYDKEADKNKNWPALEKYDETTIKNLITSLTNLMNDPKVTKNNYQSVTWAQIQHYLLKGVYLDANDSNLPSDVATDKEGYWWRRTDDNPNAQTGPVQYDIDKFLAILDRYINDTPDDNGAKLTDNDLKDQVDIYYTSDRLNIHVGSVSKNTTYEDATTNTPRNNAKTRLVNLAKNLKNKQKVSTAIGRVDWYVLQYYVFNNVAATTVTLKTPAEAKAWLESQAGYTGWKPADGHTEPTIEEAAMLTMMAMMMTNRPNTTVDVAPETGITTVTTTTDTELENGLYLTVETVTTIDPETNATTTKTITTLMDEDGNVISSTETVTGQPEPEFPAESPVPTESETPAPSESVGADVPIGPETSPEPTESPEPDDSPSPEPSETPADPEPTPTPAPDPSEPAEELPDPEPPQEDQPSQEPSDPEKEDTTKDDPASPSGGGGTGEAGDEESQETEKPENEVDLTATPPPNLSTTALTRSWLAQNGNYISNRLPSSANGGGRLRRPTLPKIIGPSQGLLTRWTPDRLNILTIGRTQA